MPFDWKQYLTLAEFLRDHTGPGADREAAQRSAVSRAYYAAFGLAREFAATREGFILLGDAEDHQRLQQHFSQWKRRDVADQLRQMRRWRNDADYHPDLANLPLMVKESIREAHRVKNKLERATPPASPPSAP